MVRRRIDWKDLEPALRKLKKDDLLQVLHDAYQQLPVSRVVSVFGEYVDLLALESPSTNAKGAAPGRLLKAVKRFHVDSLAGQYYESFDVNSKNFMDTSEGTDLWINECNQLFDKCVQLSAKGHHTEARSAMDLLFELLAEIDRGNDEIIFFADEGGSWQVGLDEEKVMSAYFSSLAATATPEEYANSVRILIEEHGSYNREKFLKSARKVANAAQRKALNVQSTVA